MNATPPPVVSAGSKPAGQKPMGNTKVLKRGKRRIVGGTKFGKDGCGY